MLKMKFKWLYPGMKIKRWISLSGLGVIIVVIGVVLLVRYEHRFLWKLLESLLVLLGITILVYGIKRMIGSFISLFLPQREKELVDIVYKKRYLERGPKIVTIGGGTGLSVLLHGLKEYTSNLTAIVTVADNGGSSGRLREQFDVLPPGDIRNCLVALADAEPLMRNLFQFRFDKGSELGGHNFGNLFITAMTKLTGDFELAIKESSKVLAIRGQVIPSTLNKVSLVAQYQDGSITEGEAQIPQRGSQIKRVYLRPKDSSATPESIKAIQEADAIVLGPGSLYTSIIPNLLIKDIQDAILTSKALKIYVCNVMTQAGETDGYTALDHLNALVEHTHPKIVEYCIINTASVPRELKEKYKEEGAYPVVCDGYKIRKAGYKTVEEEIISVENYVRHDPAKLAHLVINLITEYKKI